MVLTGMNPDVFCAVLFAVSAAFSCVAADTSDSDWTIQLQWGIWPAEDDFGRWNGTVLLDANDDSPILASLFTNSTEQSWSMGLLEVGEGSWRDGRGWLTPTWLDASPYIKDALVKEPGTFAKIPKVWIQETGAPDKPFRLPINRFGDWHDLTAEQRNATSQTEYYTDVWSRHKAVIVMRSKGTRRVHVLCETPGRENAMIVEEDIAAGSVASLFSMSFPNGISAPDPHNTAPAWLVNSLPLVVSTPSKKIYIGAEIPPWCIWKADFQLADAYLDSLPKWQVDAAFERRVHPEDPAFLRSIRSTLFMMR